jgi:putative MATE family efflux protein
MKKKIDLTTGNILKKLLIVAIPTLFTSIVQMSYNLTDMFWVGKIDTLDISGTDAIAAVGTAGYYMWFGFGLILLVKIGTSVKVSQAAGKDDMEEVKRIGNNGLVFMFALAAIYSLIGYFGADLYMLPFKDKLGGNIISESTTYLKIVSMFVVSFFMVNFFNGVYDGLGKTINTFLITASGLILNIVLDPIFILEDIELFGNVYNGLGMGVKGAAIATVISQSFILFIYIVVYSTKFRPFRIKVIKYFDWNKIKEIAKIGLPVGIQSMLFTTIAIIVAIMVASYGDNATAIQRLGSQIEALAWMIASGFQVALASFVGQNYGAGKMDRVKDGYLTALKLLVPYGIFINIIMFVFAEQMIGLFIDDVEALAIGKRYLEILSVSQLFMIIELGTAGAFNGLGKTRIPSTVGFLGNLTRIPLGIMLALPLGVYGIWWAVSMSSILKGIVLTVWFLMYLRKLKLFKTSS